MGQLTERYKHYRVPQKYMEEGVYPYFREITSKQGPEVIMGGRKILMFGSNAYTGLTGDQRIIDAGKAALTSMAQDVPEVVSSMERSTSMCSSKKSSRNMSTKMQRFAFQPDSLSTPVSSLRSSVAVTT